jgi:predicted ATP-grasp superfamily ATP-dependent carboligase
MGLSGAARGPGRRAYVLGDVDLVAALGAAGIPCVPVVHAGDAAAFSRFAVACLRRPDPPDDGRALVDRLLQWAGREAERPVLYYGNDPDLLLVSRHRAELATAFDFVVPDARLVEDLTDKARFQALAQRAGLPVPAARHLDPAQTLPSAADELTFPVVVKPLTRQGLRVLGSDAKAVQFTSRADLERAWPALAAAGVHLLAQQLVPGPESAISSYHAYVDEDAEVVVEFTGVKIRTDPPEFGHSTALAVSDDPEVLRSGREVVRAIDLRGVVKVDYKRGPDGTLCLLEVNPRFSLWHHLGAAAGVNVPAVVHADLTGRPRPRTQARAGTTWCHPWEDRWAARPAGVSTGRWLLWAARCDARSGADWDDPMPFLRGMLLPALGRRLGRRDRLSVAAPVAVGRPGPAS